MSNFCTTLSRDNKRPFCAINICGKDFDSLIDTGSSVSAMGLDTFKRLFGDNTFRQLKCKNYTFHSANGRLIEIYGLYMVPIKIGDRTYNTPIYVIKDLACSVLLGIDFVNQSGLIINGKTRKLILDNKELPSVTRPVNNNGHEINHINKKVTQESYGRTIKNITLPGHSLCYINISGPRDYDKEYFTTCYDKLNEDLTIYNTISKLKDNNDQYKIAIGNNTAAPMIIQKGEKIANLHPMRQTFKAPQLMAMEMSSEINGKKLPKPFRLLDGDKKLNFIKRLKINCPDQYKDKYIKLLCEYHDVFSKDEYDLGWTDRISHRIKLDTDKPINNKQFRIPLPHQKVISEFITEMLDKKLIETARSRYNSPIFCVKKKDGNWRPVVDLRAINKATIEDFYSIRDVRSCIDEIGSNRSSIFSTMDLAKGFFQQNLEPSSRPYTAFTLPGHGSYQFTVSCFGSHGAPSSFSYLMTEVLRNVKNIISYIDDILCHTRTHEDHLTSLEECFKRLRNYNLKLSLEKSNFGANATEYLGFKLTENGVLPGTDKTKAVKNFPIPKTVRQIRQFVGLASFFRDHIPQFSRISGYLTGLTKKDSGWKGGILPENSLKAFYTLKRLLTSEPLISFARNDIPFRVYCDASAGTTDKNNVKISGGLGAVLTQKWEDGKERVIGYASRKLHKAEENYSAYLLELLATTFAVEHFHHYLYGSPRFIIFSDHKPLSKLNKVHQKTLGRLEEKLLPYNYVINYRKGEDQQAADFLSRNAIDAVNASWKKPELDQSSIFSNLKPEQITKEQQNDSNGYKLFKFLKFGDLPDKSDKIRKFILNNKSNMTLNEEEIILINDNDQTNIYLPQKYIKQVLRDAHDSLIGGHRDAMKTYSRINGSYWWFNIHNDIKHYIKTCDTCQRVNNPQKKTLTAPLVPHKISKRFNERVHADLMGPLKSNSENKYILVMSDSFTKWIELIPIKDKSAEVVTEAIYNNWICRNSKMNILLTDNGKEFVNETMEKLCNEMHIKHVKTSPYHPQTNAQCERQNRTIISYLKSFLQDSTLNWESLLPSAQLSYNTQVHKSTSYSPFFLRHLIDPALPFENINDRKPRYNDNWTNEAMLRLQYAWKETFDHLTKAQSNQKHYYDKRTSKREFNEGDLVMCHDTTTTKSENNKLTHSWRGPFVIFKIISPTNVLIKKTPTSKLFNVHVNRLKKYNPFDLFKEGSPSGYLNSPHGEDGTGEYPEDNVLVDERGPNSEYAQPTDCDVDDAFFATPNPKDIKREIKDESDDDHNLPGSSKCDPQFQDDSEEAHKYKTHMPSSDEDDVFNSAPSSPTDISPSPDTPKSKWQEVHDRIFKGKIPKKKKDEQRDKEDDSTTTTPKRRKYIKKKYDEDPDRAVTRSRKK